MVVVVQLFIWRNVQNPTHTSDVAFQLWCQLAIVQETVLKWHSVNGWFVLRCTKIVVSPLKPFLPASVMDPSFVIEIYIIKRATTAATNDHTFTTIVLSIFLTYFFACYRKFSCKNLIRLHLLKLPLWRLHRSHVHCCCWNAETKIKKKFLTDQVNSAE